MKKIICITGMPRSGTSWIAQLIDASPDADFRMEPVWAYALKNQIGVHSSESELLEFFGQAKSLDDDVFMNQEHRRASGTYPRFEKNDDRSTLVYKTTRHFDLTAHIIETLSARQYSLLCVVRNPCGSINSWMNTPKEFADKGCGYEDWKTGRCRKGALGEHWGFTDWVKSTELFVELERRYPNCMIVRYEDVVKDTEAWLERVYHHAGLALSAQPVSFARNSHSRNDPDPYAVFKGKDVANRWRNELAPEIIEQVYQTVEARGLSRFL